MLGDGDIQMTSGPNKYTQNFIFVFVNYSAVTRCTLIVWKAKPVQRLISFFSKLHRKGLNFAHRFIYYYYFFC